MRCAPTVAMAGLVLLAGCARLGGDALQQSHNGALPLADGDTLSQTFTPGGTPLVEVDLLTATYGQALDGALLVRLRDADGGRLLAQAEVPGSAVADNGWTAARFAPAVAPPARATLEVRREGAAAVGLYASVLPLDAAAGRLANDPYDGGELAGRQGDLAFRVLGSPDGVALPRRIAGAGGHLLATLARDPAFAALWALLLAGCAVLWLRARRRPGTARQLSQDGADQQHGQRQEARP